MADENFFDNEDDELLLATVERSLTRPTNYEQLDGFDETAGEVWVYPINYPLRSYQFNIVQKALFWNTLVTLPTGLGKTFVAAVVIHNFYRWYPKGKILFMAPTKPLVAQQIRACHDIVGIPQHELGELTGNLTPARRDKIWSSKRVFFLTPQIVQNDLGRGSCPASEIVLVVIDEAHKATGNHAYCQVVRELHNYKSNFRVLALSATPGDNLTTVQSVLTALCIAHVEIRSEESIDIQPYTHKKNITKIILPLGTGLQLIKDTLVKEVLEPYVTVLKTHRALYCQEVSNLSKYTLLQQRESWRGRNTHLPGKVASMVEGVYFVLMNLYHAYELLLVHGAGTFLHYCIELLEGRKGNNSTKSKLLNDGAFLSLIDKVQRWRNSGKIYEQNNVKFVDHPKLEKLEEILLKHFRSSDTATRAMVFSSFRDSVQDLVKYINAHSPTLRATVFVGQSGEKGLKQKEQIATVQRFKKGEFNILVATCVGEEGLDIGMVDLIVCYDASSSPTRLVQRMGRAARKREGSVVVLLTQGKEETIFKKSMSSKSSVSKAVMTRLHTLVLYQDNPRMIPKHLNPVPDKQVLQPVQFVTPPPKERSKTSLQKQKCPYLSSTQYNSYVNVSPLAQKAMNYSLSGCLSNWIHWQGTEHPTFVVDHSMSTLTFVHVMEVNDLFRSEPAAITKYEEEMLQYLNLDDVIVSKESKPNLYDVIESKNTKPPESNVTKNPKKAKYNVTKLPKVDSKSKPSKAPKTKNIVISDDDEEFESHNNKLKQSKLNFNKAVTSQQSKLFSCIPKSTVNVAKSADVKTVDVEESTLDDDKEASENDDRSDDLQENMNVSPNIMIEMPEICDIQHDTSLDGDIPFSYNSQPPSNTFVSPSALLCNTPDIGRHDLKDNAQFVTPPPKERYSTSSTHQQEIPSGYGNIGHDTPKSAAKLINDNILYEDDMSLSLFEAINETWELELTQFTVPQPPLDDNVPSQIPDISDTDLFAMSSQIPTSRHIDDIERCIDDDNHHIDDLDDIELENDVSVKDEISAKGAAANLPKDDTFDILCSQAFPDTQTIGLFESLAKLEKETTAAENEADDDVVFDDIPDITMTDLEPTASPPVHADRGTKDLESVESLINDISMSDFEDLPAAEMSYQQNKTDSEAGRVPLTTVPIVTPKPVKFAPPSSSTPAVPKQGGKISLSRKKDPFVAPLVPASVPPITIPPSAPPRFVAPVSPLCARKPTKETSPKVTTKETSPKVTTPNPSTRCSLTNASSNVSAEDSPLIVGKRKRRCNILSSQMPSLSVNEPCDDYNELKKSRYLSPLKPTVKHKAKLKSKCLFVEEEADVSGDDEGEEGEDEDVLTSSLEDFLDTDTQIENQSSMYLQDMASRGRQHVRTVGNMCRGDVYSQDPRNDAVYEEQEDGEFDSFICDDEEYSLADCLEETALFTQQIHATSPLMPSPQSRRKKKRTRRVKQFESMCETPPKSKLTKSFDQIASPTITLNPGVSVQSPRGCSVNESSEDPAEKSTFLLGLEDLLDVGDEEEVVCFSDDDFEERPKKQLATQKNTSISKNNKSIRHDNKEHPATQRHANISHNDTDDLFGQSFSDSLIDQVCEEMKGTDSRDKQPQLGHMTASQFQLGLDDLIPTPLPLAERLKKNAQLANIALSNKTSSVVKATKRNSMVASKNEENKNSKNKNKSSIHRDSNPNVIPLNDITPKTSVSNVPNISDLPGRDLKDCLILVRTRVVSNNQICSILRTRFKCSVEIRTDLEGCDYVVNTRTAVLRILLTDVYKGLQDVLHRAEQLCTRFKHIVFITELPPPKAKKKVGQKAEVYDAVRCSLAARQVQSAGAFLQFSNSQEETAELITKLVLTPGSLHIPTDVQTDKQAGLERVLVTVPCVNAGVARVLSLKFPSLAQLLSSKPDEIIRASDISRLNAALLLKYCKTNVASQVSAINV